MVGAVLVACSNQPTRNRAPGTVRMAARLQEIATSVDPRKNPYASAALVDSLRASEPPTEPGARLQFNAMLAQQLLHAGRTDEAIEHFRQVLDAIEQHREQVSTSFTLAVRDLLAISYLRLEHENNCAPPHATPRCSVPTTEEAGHTTDRGAAGAGGAGGRGRQ